MASGQIISQPIATATYVLLTNLQMSYNFLFLRKTYSLACKGFLAWMNYFVDVFCEKLWRCLHWIVM